MIEYLFHYSSLLLQGFDYMSDSFCRFNLVACDSFRFGSCEIVKQFCKV